MLLEHGSHAPSLSLSVLALEELAKLYAIDGLLYARNNDHKTDAFVKACTSHDAKLIMFEAFPLFLGNLCKADARYGNDEAFAQAVAISIGNLKHDGNTVMASLGEDAFLRLNTSKQEGFYVRAKNNGFVTPREAIDPAFAEIVHRLAWRATTTLDFLLKDGNVDRYIAKARDFRSALTEEEHQELERVGKAWFVELFSSSNAEVAMGATETEKTQGDT